jgi:tetratricopeptide (TPR) repeat protein
VRLVLLTLLLSLAAVPQTPSTDEQQYLFSVLPLIDRGELSAAEGQLLAGLARYSKSAILYNALGIVYRKENRIEEAANAFRKALGILPSFTAAQLQLASIYQQQGKKTGAAELFRAAGESTTNFDALMASGQGLADCDDLVGAARVFTKARAAQPDSASAAYNLALAQYKGGDLASAAQTLASITSSDADILYLRAKILEASGKPQTTDKAAACRMQPDNEAFCADAALQAIRQDHFVDAVAILTPAIEKSPASHVLLSLLGLAQFRLGRYRDAIRSYTAALKQDASVDASREGLGFLYYVTGDLEKARLTVEAGLRNSKADFYLAHLEAMILYRMSPHLRAEATEAVDRSINANPRFAPSYFLRGKIRMEQNDFQGALADFEHAAQLDPKYSLPYFKMAQIYARQGRPREAEAARRKFSELGNLREEENLARQTQDVLMPAAH